MTMPSVADGDARSKIEITLAVGIPDFGVVCLDGKHRCGRGDAPGNGSVTAGE
jgi:hypothetical protein